MSDGPSEDLSDRQKREIAVCLISPFRRGCADVRALLEDDAVYEAAAAEAFPEYNKAHLVSLELPDRSGDIIITTYGELDKNNYLDPRTAQVATVDHIKQNCTKLRPAADEELPSAYIEEFRSALDVELSKYVGEAYPKGVCAVYCTSGKDLEVPGADFGLAAVISAARRSPQNFCNGSWRSIWTLEFNDGSQFVEIKGKIQVGAHYFEEGNVQLDTNIDCKDSTIFQSPEDCAVAITNIIRHHESEYLSSLEESYLNLSDATFKLPLPILCFTCVIDLRRKLPVTRTLFPWHNTLALSLTRDLAKELAIGK
uniref:F-actin-capping protein subunit alpha n=1 Tax=Leersia perrieri TaxID=77586 RepID=A0A0D9WXY0_9ORYZ